MLLALLVGFVLVFTVRTGTTGLAGGSWSGSSAWGRSPRWLSLTVIFLLTVATLGTVAQEVARTFATFEPLDAYRLDIGGSLRGIVTFAGLSFLRMPPLAWAVLSAVVFVLLLGPRVRSWRWLPAAAIAVTVVVLGLESFVGVLPVVAVLQDPHRDGVRRQRAHRREQHPAADHRLGRADHQGLAVLPLPVHVRRAPRRRARHRCGHRQRRRRRARQGAQRVDAVEIDPALVQIGRDRHPDRPYSDPRVSVHVDDGRAFMERTGARYDLVLFALPDSATIVTGQSALRLENYLFTTQALERARSLLTPGGTFAMYNYYEPWLLDRYANTIRTVYGTAPCVQLGPTHGQRQQAVLSLRDDATTGGCTTTWTPRVAELEPSVDDRPFPYLGTRTIPSFYLWMLALVLTASLVLVRWVGGPLKQMAPYTDLFFMGVAFLLLETKNVVQFALLFGTTWAVNAAVFTGVLLSVLAAIEVARRVRIARPVLLYPALLAALVLAWVVPGDLLLDLSPVPRFLVGVTIAFLPIFVANLIFAVRFKGVGDSTTAFGANLLGAMVGGALEYLALILGFNALLVVVAVCYTLALATGRKHLVPAAT